MNQELRQMVGEALAFGDVMDEANLGVSRFGHDEKTARFIRLDMVKFLLYLSTSDDVIHDSEAQFFRDYLGYNFETATITSLIDKFELKKETFHTTVPFSFGVMIEADSIVTAQTGKNPGAAMALLRVYHALGSAFVQCDEDVSEEERKDFSEYLTMLRDTIEEAVQNAMAQYEKSQEDAADTDDGALQSDAPADGEEKGAEASEE